jgi:hypothetical protein
MYKGQLAVGCGQRYDFEWFTFKPDPTVTAITHNITVRYLEVRTTWLFLEKGSAQGQYGSIHD